MLTLNTYFNPNCFSELGPLAAAGLPAGEDAIPQDAVRGQEFGLQDLKKCCPYPLTSAYKQRRNPIKKDKY